MHFYKKACQDQKYTKNMEIVFEHDKFLTKNAFLALKISTKAIFAKVFAARCQSLQPGADPPSFFIEENIIILTKMDVF